MGKWLILVWLLLPLSRAFAGTPCDGVERDLGLTAEQIVTLKANIGPQVNATKIDIINVFKMKGWSVIYIDTHNSDETYLFFTGDILTSHYVTEWSGAATIFEGAELTTQFKQNAPGIPEHLAQCMAWHIAEQGKLPGVYSSLKVHPETFDILGDEMLFTLAEEGKYWVVYQHAEGGVTKPVVAPVKIDSTTGHFTFRLPGEMASLGEFHGRITEDDDLLGIFDNGYSVKLPRKASFWQ